MLSQLAGGIKHILCDPIRRDSEKVLPGLLQTSPHVPFPLADLALYLYSVVINQSHEYNYMLNPSRKSSNLRVVLGNPNTAKGRSQSRTSS